MSIAVELPPAMEHEAVEYASVRGTTLQQMFLDYLKRELDRMRGEAEIPGRALEESFRESEAMSSGDLPKRRFETVEELFAECASCGRSFGPPLLRVASSGFSSGIGIFCRWPM